MTTIVMTRVGPLCTIQDLGRPGMLQHGISASGPMDRGAFDRAGFWIGGADSAGIEFTTAGIGFEVIAGDVGVGFGGGSFSLRRNGEAKPWPARLRLTAGDVVDITPGPAGNYGYVRFDREVDVAPVLGSRSTNLVVGLGGLEGRSLRAGDMLDFGDDLPSTGPGLHPQATKTEAGPIRVTWGLHADLFPEPVRQRFLAEAFAISSRIDRMGARLIDPSGVFAEPPALSLVSDAIVAGDIQILGDGTPIVLLRDHQPTGGYPRIATVISADPDRFTQLRPGADVRFKPVTLSEAQAILKARTP